MEQGSLNVFQQNAIANERSLTIRRLTAETDGAKAELVTLMLLDFEESLDRVDDYETEDIYTRTITKCHSWQKAA